MKKLILLSIITVLVCMLCLSACNETTTTTSSPTTQQPSASPTQQPVTTSTQQPSASPSTPQPTTQPDQPQYGGTLKIISGLGPVAFGYPPASGPLDSAGSLGVLEALVGVDLQGEPTPKLATDWAVSEDGKSVKFTLRKGVKFHDMTDFNAQAVKWMVDLYIEARLITTVASIDILDDYTVQFNLPQYNNAVFTQISDLMYISPTAVEKHGEDWAKTNAVGTGPFMQKEFKRDVSMTKVKFDSYWDTGKPYLDALVNIFIPDTTTAKISFEAGEAQILSIGSDGKVANELIKKGFAVRGMPGMAQFFSTDSANEDSPFYDIKVRQALEYAIDKKSITSSVGQGYMDALYQIIPPGMVGHNSDIKGLVYNVDMAKQLLTEAGYPNGFTTKLMGIQGFTNPDVMTAVQAYLKDVGIDATVDMMDMGRGFGTLMQGWKNGIMFSGTGLDPNMCQRISSDLSATSAFHPCLYKPPEWQATLDLAMAARDLAGREKYLQQLMQVVADSEFIVPLWAIYDIAAMTPSVHCDLLEYHHIKWNPANAWLSK